MKILLVHTPFNYKKPLTIVSHLIRKVARTYYNHAAFLIEYNGLQFIIESDIHGVVKTPLKEWIREQSVKVYEIPAALEFNAHNKAMSMVSKLGYSFIDLLWFMPIFILTNKYYGLTKEESCNKPTCYEFIARVLNFNNWWRMTPNELKDELNERGYLCLGDFKAHDLLK